MIYRSNLTCPDLTGNFKYTVCRVMPHSLGHDLLSDFADKADNDPVFGIHKRCSFLSHDEAAILFHCAKTWQGMWVDIGCHVGWSTLHIWHALEYPLESVIAIDPMLSVPDFLERFSENAPVVREQGWVSPNTSAEWLFNRRWTGTVSFLGGAMIDGNHDEPEPLKDAQGVAVLCLDDACIVFHDLLGLPIQDAVVWLLDNGWNARIYYTPHMMAVAYRGAFTPPDHVRAPDIDWAFVARNMPTFPFERCS